MKNIAAQLESYCKEHPIRMDDRETILESLYWLYTESVPTDSKKLRDGYAKLREQLHFLKPREYDAVFDTITELCTKSEQPGTYAILVNEQSLKRHFVISRKSSLSGLELVQV